MVICYEYKSNNYKMYYKNIELTHEGRKFFKKAEK
mgnify:CR=1 FL=1